MKSQPAKSARKTARRKSSKPGKLPKPVKVDEYPDLQDRFTQETQELSRNHLLEEQREKLDAMTRLHRAQMRSIQEQLQLALFKIWNEMWLQKKEAQAKAHKDWLKVLAA